VQKSEEAIDSVSFHLDQESHLIVQHFSQTNPRFNQMLRFRYVQKKLYPLFNCDGYNGFYGWATFPHQIRLNCYEFPDTNVHPRPFEFDSKEPILHVYSMTDATDKSKRYHLIYFGLKNKSKKMYYEDCKYHLWVKEADLIQHYDLETRHPI
jgi:hypothetical protein